MFTFRVTPDHGEPFEVVAKERDVVRWEKGANGRKFGGFSDPSALSYVDLTALAHTACRREGLFDGPLNEFETTVDVRLIGGEGMDPTQSAP